MRGSAGGVLPRVLPRGSCRHFGCLHSTVLPADEGEAWRELGQGLGHGQRQGLLDGMFLGVFGETKEVQYQGSLATSRARSVPSPDSLASRLFGADVC